MLTDVSRERTRLLSREPRASKKERALSRTAPAIIPAMWDELPGSELVRRGLADLARGEETVEALLVSIGAPRLRRLGLDVPESLPDPEHRLYLRLHAVNADAAHSRYNALLRRLVRFERAAECAG
jgi:hypothetical protein